MRDRTSTKVNLILTGLMGCGKTTVGRLIADQLGWTLIDTDRLIEETTGCSIPVLFREKGEAFFRRVEKETIQGLVGRTRTVVATGGGAVLDEGNRRVLQALGLVVYLQTTPEALAARVGRSGDRPLLSGEDPVAVLAALLKAREQYYSEADEVITTDGRTPAQVGAEIIRLAQRWGLDTTPPDGRRQEEDELDDGQTDRN